MHMSTCQTNVKNAQKQANSTIEQMKDVVDEFLDDLPIDFLDDKTLKNLYNGMTQTVEGAQKSLSKFRHDNGIKLERTKISNKDATNLILEKQITPALKRSQREIHDLGASLRELKSLKDFNLSRSYHEVTNDLMRNSLMTPEAQLAWEKAGGDFDAFQTVVAAMPHQQRLDTIVNMQDGFPVEFDRLVQHLSELDTKNIPAKRALDTLETLRDIEFRVNGAIDTASMYARNPYADATDLSSSYIAQTESFNNSVDRRVIKEQFVDDGIQNLVKKQFGSLTESLATKLLKTQVPGAQMFALNVLETPSGFAGDIVRPNTGSIRASMLHKRSIHEVNQAYSSLLDTVGELEGWGTIKRQIMQDGHASTHPEIAKLNQDVMIHINNQKLGRPSDAPAHIKQYADIQTKEYGKIHDNGIGKVEGITAKNKIQHYDPQIYNDHKILELANNPRELSNVVELFRKGLIGGGMDDDIAFEVATALMQQKMSTQHRAGLKSSPLLGEQDIAGLMPRLQEVVEQMESNNVRPADIRRFIDAFQGGVEDSQPGYANRRLNLDLEASHTINGENIRLVDLMEQDSAGKFDRYSKEANGRIGIAEAMPGLNSDDAMNDYIFNVGKQAQLMGTSVDTKAMRNILNIIMGKQPEGSLPMDVRKIRDAVSLAGMGGLGESQLAELGMAMNRGVSGLIGTAQMLSGRKGRRGTSKGIDLTPEQQSNVKFLGEQEELTGLYQNAHRIVRRNIHYDQKDSDFGAMSKVLDTVTGGKYRNVLKAAQDRFTGYGAIRSMQDQLAMSSLLQDINKAARGEIPFTSVKRFKDLGIDIESPNNVFFKNINEHAVLNTDGTIRELNIHKWSPADRDTAGIILNRHAAQVVQRGFEGEMSPLMTNPWVSFMMQFRSYPLLAAEKQQARHLKFADKEAATGIFLNAVSSSGARILRYSSVAAAQPIGEREDYMRRQMGSLGADTWAYMGVAGMTPTISSYATQLMGHPFGLGQDGRNVEGLHTEIPALSYATKMMNAHNSVTNGESMNDNDYARIQSLAPLGTIGFVNLMAGVFRTGLNQ